LHKLGRLLLAATFCLSIPSVCDAAAFRLGDTGQEISEIQQALASSGYDVSVDGDFGPATQEAVRQFQRDHHLTADGLVGDQSYQALLHRAMPKFVQHKSYLAGISAIIGTAQQFLGVPYVWGGSSPSGFDCSGFVQYVYAKHGINLPRTADIQISAGQPVSKSDLQPGDLVFFAGDYVNISHVGIYVGNGQMIHASSTHGIAYDSLSRDYRVAHYAGACRVIG
jgi:cell wall-associated NlpC family hydrolase